MNANNKIVRSIRTDVLWMETAQQLIAKRLLRSVKLNRYKTTQHMSQQKLAVSPVRTQPDVC